MSGERMACGCRIECLQGIEPGEMMDAWLRHQTTRRCSWHAKHVLVRAGLMLLAGWTIGWILSRVVVVLVAGGRMDWGGLVMMYSYVVGFAFEHRNMDNVILVEKIKPAFMAGQLNGIGGSIEIGETPQQAMTREFREETTINPEPWTEFAVLYRPTAAIHCFYTILGSMGKSIPDANDVGERFFWVDKHDGPTKPLFDTVPLLISLATARPTHPVIIRLRDLE